MALARDLARLPKREQAVMMRIVRLMAEGNDLQKRSAHEVLDMLNVNPAALDESIDALEETLTALEDMGEDA